MKPPWLIVNLVNYSFESTQLIVINKKNVEKVISDSRLIVIRMIGSSLSLFWSCFYVCIVYHWRCYTFSLGRQERRIIGKNDIKGIWPEIRTEWLEKMNQQSLLILIKMRMKKMIRIKERDTHTSCGFGTLWIMIVSLEGLWIKISTQKRHDSSYNNLMVNCCELLKDPSDHLHDCSSLLSSESFGMVYFREREREKWLLLKIRRPSSLETRSWPFHIPISTQLAMRIGVFKDKRI